MDELERRLEELGAATVAAVQTAPSHAGSEATQPQAPLSSTDTDEAEQRCVSLAWRLEEARAALVASEAALAEKTSACSSAEQRAGTLQMEAEAATARAEAAEAALVQERALAQETSARHAGERKTMSREIKSLRRDLASAQTCAAAASTEAVNAAVGGIAAQLSHCLREATLVRERMAEASVERMASAEETVVDPLELLAVSDSRVALLAAEAQLLGRSNNQNDATSAADATHDAEVQVREALCALLSDNASLRKRVNSLLRATLGNAAAAAPGAPTTAGRERGRPWWQLGRE